MKTWRRTLTDCGQWATQEALWSVSRWQSIFLNQKMKHSKMRGLIELSEV